MNPSAASAASPVALPPGRARLATKPKRTGSPAEMNTIGIVLVAALTSSDGPRRSGHNEIGLEPNEFRRKFEAALNLPLCPSPLDVDAATLNMMQFLQPRLEALRDGAGRAAEKTDPRNLAGRLGMARGRNKRGGEPKSGKAERSGRFAITRLQLERGFRRMTTTIIHRFALIITDAAGVLGNSMRSNVQVSRRHPAAKPCRRGVRFNAKSGRIQSLDQLKSRIPRIPQRGKHLHRNESSCQVEATRLRIF